MAYDDYSGHNAYSSSGRDRKDVPVPQLDMSKLNNKDGTADMTAAYNLILESGVGLVRDGAENQAMKLAERYATHNNLTELQTHRLATRAGWIAGLATIFAKPLIEGGVKVYKYLGAKAEQSSAQAPVLKALGSTAAEAHLGALLGLVNNEIAVNSNSANFARLLTGLADTLGSGAGGLIHAVPMWAKFSARNAQWADKEAYLKAKAAGPEAEQRYWKEQLEVQIPGVMDRTKFRDMTLEEEHKKYMDGFKEFHSKNKEAVKSEIKKKLTPPTGSEYADSPWIVTKAEEFGIKLQGPFKERYYDDTRKNSGAPDVTAQRTSYNNQISKQINAEINESVERTLRDRYAKDKGAWDKTWLYGSHNKEEQTLRDSIMKRFDEKSKKLDEKLVDDKKAASDKEEGHLTQMQNGLTGLVAGAVGQFGRFLARTLVGDVNPNTVKAWHRLLHFANAVKTNGGDMPDIIPALEYEGKGAEKEKPMGYVESVVAVFNQHQKDSKGFRAIDPRDLKNFAAAGWKDEAIFRLDDSKLSDVEFMIKHVAHAIRTGMLEPMVLLVLAGDTKHKLLQRDGATIGRRNVGRDSKERRASIEKDIKSWARKMKGTEEQKETVSEMLEGVTFTIEQIRSALVEGALPEAERAFLFALMANRVTDPAKLCEVTGYTQAQCETMHKKCQDAYNAQLTATVQALDGLVHEGAVDVLNLTDDERKNISRLARETADGTRQVADIFKDEAERKSIEALAAHAIIGMDHKAEKNKGLLWKKIDAVLNPPPKAKDELEPENRQWRDSPKVAKKRSDPLMELEEAPYQARPKRQEELMDFEDVLNSKPKRQEELTERLDAPDFDEPEQKRPARAKIKPTLRGDDDMPGYTRRDVETPSSMHVRG